MHGTEKEDTVRFGQNTHTTQTFSKKNTLKRPTESSEGTIMKFPTDQISCGRATEQYTLQLYPVVSMGYLIRLFDALGSGFFQ